MLKLAFPARRLLSRQPALSRSLSLKFSKDHEWVRVEGDVAVVGITEHAQDQLGDIVFVDLPEVGATFEAGDTCGAVESVKAASDIYSPVSGTVTSVNETLADEPALVNSSPQADGWMMKMKLSKASELDELMDEAGYKAFCKS